jgi:hypothetical protein
MLLDQLNGAISSRCYKHPTEPKSFVKRGRHRLPPRKCHRLMDRLLVVSDAAAQFADPGYEAHLRYRLCVGAWPWKHVADFGDLTFRLLRRSIEFLTIYIAGWILQGSNIRASWNGRRTREGLSIRVSETERIKVAIPKPALSLEKHRQRHRLVRLYGDDCLVEHGPGLLGRAELTLLRESGG